jgi:hypothetical protein
MLSKRSRLVWLPVLSICLALGCAQSERGGGARSGEGGDKTDQQTAGGTTVITFDGDWNEKASGPIRAGHRVIVRYDISRLPGCTGGMYGQPAYRVMGNYLVDGGEPRLFEVSKVENGELVAAEAAIEVPRGRELTFFFHVSNRWGCMEYDSNFGENYHFPIESAGTGKLAVVTFDVDGVAQSEAIRGGGEVIVHYDPARLSGCRATYNGLPAWNITAFMSVDGAEPTTFEVTRAEGGERVASDPTLAVPFGRDLAFWFFISDRYGCNQYDSNDGQNYHFAIE